MSNAIGTPQMADFVHQPDNPWDVRVWDELTQGDVATLVAEKRSSTGFLAWDTAARTPGAVR